MYHSSICLYTYIINIFMESTHLYSWPLLNACSIIKHASAVFCLQIPQMPLQRLASDMHSIYKSGAGKPVCHYSSKCKAKWSGVWHARKALAHSLLVATIIN